MSTYETLYPTPVRPEILSEMQGWVIDTFGIDAADDLVYEDEVLDSIAEHYEGGIDQFIADQLL